MYGHGWRRSRGIFCQITSMSHAIMGFDIDPFKCWHKLAVELIMVRYWVVTVRKLKEKSNFPTQMVSVTLHTWFQNMIYQCCVHRFKEFCQDRQVRCFPIVGLHEALISYSFVRPRASHAFKTRHSLWFCGDRNRNWKKKSKSCQKSERSAHRFSFIDTENWKIMNITVGNAAIIVIVSARSVSSALIFSNNNLSTSV